MIDVNNFEAMKIGLASPGQIEEWSYGEVKKPETINYRTLKPERDGLFCEKIFGPVKDWECHCGKYKRVRFKGVICDKCGVEVTRSKVRRERMGHISLASPVTHIWYFKGVPSRIGLLLEMSPRILEKIIYFAAYVVIDPKDTPLKYKELLTEMEYRETRKKWGNDFVAMMGAEAIRELLKKIDLDELYTQLREDVRTLSGQKHAKAIKRLGVVDAFRSSGNMPEWMILERVPVIPPELRPMVQLDGGRFATSDLNDLYRRVINRNNRLKRLLELGAPEIIVKNEKRMLQEAVDALIDNGRRGRPVTGPNNRPLKSLSDMLKGKQGRFRQNLLGKRVDYSGRSVIVVGPNLKLHQCGLPKEMALELFKPFVMKKLVERDLVHNIKSAKKMVERVRPEVWDVLEEVITDHPVLLNRAPTLHRLGIQAFEPILVEGKAIQIHPLVCAPYNADFDGDQMAVHLPLSANAQAEARILMLSANNILQPSYGSPATTPTQDMVLGIYYLTYCHIDDPRSKTKKAKTRRKMKGEGMTFSTMDEAIFAYEEGFIELQAPINVRVSVFKETDEEIIPDENGYYKDPVEDVIKTTTVGRIIFYKAIPGEFRFGSSVRSRINPLEKVPFLNYVINKKKLNKFVAEFHSNFKNKFTAYLLDNVKSLGFKYATRSGTTISIVDVEIPPDKEDILHVADKVVERIEEFFLHGYLNPEEKNEQVIRVWADATRQVEKAMMKNLSSLNPIYLMATSGARGNPSQVKQIAGMRGLMSDPAGRIIPLPIKANLREGLSVLEYFISTHGARKGLADTALRTADSGYLTRRLIDVAQDIIVREWDCLKRVVCQSCGHINHYGMIECTNCDAVLDLEIPENIISMDGNYIWMDAIRPNEDIEENFLLYQRIRGRTLASDIKNPATEEVILKKDALISDITAEKVMNVFQDYIRSEWKKYCKKNSIELDDTDKFEIFINKMPEEKRKVGIRSVLTCRTRHGVCSNCYGRDMGSGEIIEIGETVGIIAAQSIGEPGTQLTLRTFHLGGVAVEDIIQGLPRVEELFEARKPKGFAEIASIEGIIRLSINQKKNTRVITVESLTGNEKENDVHDKIPLPTKLLVNEGDHVKPGQELTDGNRNPHDILRVEGIKAVQRYLVDEIQDVYRSQGVDINDKHLEVIVRQMLRRLKVERAGDTNFLPGSLVDTFTFEEENLRMKQEGKEPAIAKSMLLGITKSSLATDSFLSAASFQETTRVLTDAAIKGKTDYLVGLKENVIIGKLIPAGTGMRRYRQINIKPIIPILEEEDEEEVEEIN
ncbi:MAG: DNA-directed RNA polymerase subunit beta' [Candidatus Eremiobacteraeota bacterium]|nr:DNA-directed RNA polymerase subunit beta' [Candidatus Eremiobacteraeota bacterium]